MSSIYNYHALVLLLIIPYNLGRKTPSLRRCRMKNIIITLLFFLSCNQPFDGFLKPSELESLSQNSAPVSQYFEYSILTNDSKYLYGQCWQPEAKPKAIVALVHGLGEHSGRYFNLSSFLNDSGFTLISFDMRGHGKSQGQRGFIPSYNIMLDDIGNFLKTVKHFYPDKKIILYGHSFGGNLVINYTLKRDPNIDGVILSAPFLKTFFKPPAWKIMVGKLAYNIMPAITLNNSVNLNHLSRDTAIVSSRREDTLCHQQVSPRFLDAFKAGEWAINNAGKLQYSTLILHGSSDSIASISASLEFSQNAKDHCEHISLQNFYHYLHDELEKEIVFEKIVLWLNKDFSEN